MAFARPNVHSFRHLSAPHLRFVDHKLRFASRWQPSDGLLIMCALSRKISRPSAGYSWRHSPTVSLFSSYRPIGYWSGYSWRLISTVHRLRFCVNNSIIMRTKISSHIKSRSYVPHVASLLLEAFPSGSSLRCRRKRLPCRLASAKIYSISHKQDAALDSPRTPE